MCYASAMARLEPFAAIRYDPARVDPDSVVSPPYDVVGPVERAGLAAPSPYNAIHVELPVPDESDGLDQYENAARIFHGWLDAGIVRRDARAGLLPVPHDLPRRARAPAGDDRAARRARPRPPRHRRGARPRADDPEGPHRTGSRCLRSTRLNTSPIWVLSLAKGLTSACREAVSQGRGDPAGGRPTPPGWSTSSGPSPTSAMWPRSPRSARAPLC